MNIIFHDKVVVVFVVVVVLFYMSFVPAACYVVYLYSGSNPLFIRLSHSELCRKNIFKVRLLLSQVC